MQLQETLGGRYTLLEELGTGGMAVVWRARDEVLGRPVAVKVLAGRFADDPQSRARIRDEARAAAMLSHPNIAQVYDYGEAASAGTTLPYVVMELVNGPTLQQRVANGPLPPRTVFRICGEVAAALAAAHADGLVHRDVKMANIMVTTGGAKVVDFGIAAAVGPASPDEMVVGTPAYLAPERLTGGAVAPSSDVYALGVLLYRLLAHQAPWSAETTTGMLNAHIYVEPDPLPELPGVPPAIADLVARCLRKDPADRPTAAQVSAALGDAAEAATRHPDPVRAEPASPARRVPRPSGGEFAELTAVSADRRRVGSGLTEPAGGRESPERPAADRPVDDRAPDDRAAGDRAVAPAALAEGPVGAPGPIRAQRPGDAPGPGGAAGPVEPVRVNGRVAGVDGVVPGGSGPAHGSPVDAVRVDAGGEDGNSVPKGRRMAVLAGGAVATVLIAGLAVWGLVAGDDGGRAGAAPGGASAAAPPVPATGASSGAGDGSAAADPATGGTRPAAVGDTVAPPGSPASPADGPATNASPTSSGPASAPPPAGTRLSSPGGVVYAQCEQGRATLTRWAPADGYRVQQVDPGPALTPEIVFAGLSARYRMTVTCVAGLPTQVVLPL